MMRMSKDEPWGKTVPGHVTIGGINIGTSEILLSPYIDEMQREVTKALTVYVKKYNLPVDSINCYLNMRNQTRREYMFTIHDIIDFSEVNDDASK